MAEVVLFRLAGKILSTLTPYALDQIGLPWYAKEKLKKLENKISTIKNVLLHAQEMQNNNPAVKEWLRRLKTILEEADDLFDEVATEALRREIIINKSKKKKVLKFFTSSNPVLFHYSLGCNIKDIREKLEDISSEMRDFGFVVKTLEKPIIKRNEGTISFVDTQKVIGREDDKRTLLQLLLSSNNERDVNVIPIVGMGGLGKTTLAQMIFNDDVVKKHFDKVLWVCVSDDFNVERISREILKAAGVNVMNLGMEQLQISFRTVLGSKKFFLVLDDVWNDDPVKWEILENLLMTGARGSMVLVTTRDKKVASIVRTMRSYVLKGLTESECLSIFVKWAFEKGEETKHPDLIEIGREIVKKCGGVPLAARTLGVLLFSKTSRHEWLSVRDSEIWAQVQNENDIIPILKLSYNQMSSSLKECFAYCSLFRKDEKILKEQLMYNWIAHGLILPPSDKTEELEDVCETYFGELLRRSFLDYVDGRCLYFKMHDLVHDLAQYVAGGESLIVKGKSVPVASDRVRHVSFDPNSEIPNSIVKGKKLRTIMRRGTFLFDEDMPIYKGTSRCRSLRVLDDKTLNCNNDFLKDNKKLKHLRYLQCYDTPAILCDLLNLQFLEVHSSYNLTTDCLENLRSLRVFIFSPYLKCLPGGIQNLVSLHKLVIRNSVKLRKLGVGLRNITSLVHLEIEACDRLEFSDHDFQGLTSLKYLKLSRLPRVKQLPRGLEDSSVTLNHLVLDHCDNMTLTEQIVPNVQSLEVLVIHYCERITSLPVGIQRLHKLSHLEINDCRDLENEDCDLLLKYYDLIGKNISHVPHIYINGTNIKSVRENKQDNEVEGVPASGRIVAPNLKMFTYSELKIATRNFRSDSVVGEGGFGQVFKGWVDPNNYTPSKPGIGMLVAIKLSSPNSLQGIKEWQVEILGNFCHPNLVKLLGYCEEKSKLLLVYEYMNKGSLENHLFNKNFETLSWETRIQIATGAARGLVFLHTAEKIVIYRDFKASNILLDEDFNAKLSDFGHAKLMNGRSLVTTDVMGTYGYAAPEYMATGRLYVKSDVYGFGVVLLEILTGLRVLDLNRPTSEQNLVKGAMPILPEKGKLKKIMDPRLDDKYPLKAAFRVAKIVLQCLKSDPQNRPSMKEVLANLEQISDIE